MTKLETVETDLTKDIEREIRNIQIAARKLAKRFTEIAQSDRWDEDPYDLPRDVGVLLYKMGNVAGLLEAIHGVTWAQDKPQCGGVGGGAPA